LRQLKVAKGGSFFFIAEEYAILPADSSPVSKGPFSVCRAGDPPPTERCRKRGGHCAERKSFVGNLSYSVDKKKLREVFAGYGEVQSVNVIAGKGFGFVEMGTREEAEREKTGLRFDP